MTENDIKSYLLRSHYDDRRQQKFVVTNKHKTWKRKLFLNEIIKMQHFSDRNFCYDILWMKTFISSLPHKEVAIWFKEHKVTGDNEIRCQWSRENGKR